MYMLPVNVIFGVHGFSSIFLGPVSDLVICNHWKDYFWFKYDLGQKYYAPQVRPDRGLNSWPPDHDSTLHGLS